MKTIKRYRSHLLALLGAITVLALFIFEASLVDRDTNQVGHTLSGQNHYLIGGYDPGLS